MELYSHWSPQAQQTVYGIRINKRPDLFVRARWRHSEQEAIKAYKRKNNPKPWGVEKIATTYHGPVFDHNSPEAECTCEVLFWTQGHDKHCPYIKWKNRWAP